MSNNIIYGLFDKRDNVIRYIGKSATGMNRPKQHGRPYNLREKNHKSNWIKKIREEGSDYDVMVIEDIGDISDTEALLAKLNEREMFWIAFYRGNGHNLVNATDGGGGSIGLKHTEETKLLISKNKSTPPPSEKQLATCYKRKEHVLIDGIESKECNKCHDVKSMSDFNKQITSWDGHCHTCRVCSKTYLKPYKKVSDEQRLEANKIKAQNGRKMHEMLKNDPLFRKNFSTKMSKPVIAKCINTGNVTEFASATEAKKHGFDNGNIGQAIKKNKPYKGYMWSFKLPPKSE